MSDEAVLPNSRTTGRLTGRLLRSNGFAWTLSILLHAGLFLAFYQMGFGKLAPGPRRLIIPEARLAVGPSPVLPRADQPVNLMSDRPPAAAASVGRAPRMDELPILSVPTPGPQTHGSVVSAPPALALPGVDVAGTGTGLGVAGVGGSGTAIGPVSRFFGQTGNAYKIVYVVDVSASLMIYMDDIMREMQDSIRELVPTQEFHIVLAMPQKIRELEPRRLVSANAKYKSSAYDLIKTMSVTPGIGKADPIEAMRRAFAAGPELIYFLSDGDYLSIDDKLFAALEGLNPQGDVKITVIGFSWRAVDKPGEPVPPQKTLLQRIAREHGGHCRFVE